MTSKQKRKKKNEGSKRATKRASDVMKNEKINEKSSRQEVELDAGGKKSDSRGATKKVGTRSSKSEEAKAASKGSANTGRCQVSIHSRANKYSSGIGVLAQQENAANKYSSGIGVWAQQENAANKYSSGIGVWAQQENRANKYSLGIGVSYKKIGPTSTH